MPAREEPRWPGVCLGLVCVAYLVAQVVWVGRVPLGWDESVYVSQVDPRLPALEFSAPRSRGTSLMLWPVESLTGSVAALRVYLAVLSSVGLFVAYRAWRPLTAPSVPPLAALLLTTLWMTLFYGPAAMPNLAVALAAVAAVAWFLRAAAQSEGKRPERVALAVALAFAALLRPGDAAPVVAALTLATLVRREWRARWARLLPPVLGGAAAGVLPWVVEAQQRYGDVVARARRALAAQSTGERFVPDYQLRALDGPILRRPCRRAVEAVPLSGLLWWSVAAVLVTVGLLLARRQPQRLVPLALATAVAAFSAGPYLLLVGYAAPRFLLPAYALLALPAAYGVWALVRGVAPRVRPVVVAGVVLVLAVHTIAQVRILWQITADQRRDRESWVAAAADLARLGVRPPCTLAGSNATPVARVAGCDSVRVSRHRGDEDFSVADLQRRVLSEPVAVLERRGTPPPAWARGWVRPPGGRLPSRPDLVVLLPPAGLRPPR
jgi:hypothetical protein